MKRTETLELLIEIQEAIEHFEKRIDEAEWSNNFGIGLEYPNIKEKNTHNIIIYVMCLERLSERFTKQLNTLK